MSNGVLIALIIVAAIVIMYVVTEIAEVIKKKDLNKELVKQHYENKNRYDGTPITINKTAGVVRGTCGSCRYCDTEDDKEPCCNCNHCGGSEDNYE